MRANFLLLATKFGHQVHQVVEDADEKLQVASDEGFEEPGHHFGIGNSVSKVLHACPQSPHGGHRRNGLLKLGSRLS